MNVQEMLHRHHETAMRLKKASEFYGIGVERIAAEAGLSPRDVERFQVITQYPETLYDPKIEAALRTWLKSLPSSISSRISDVVERVGVERAEAACGEGVLRWCVGHTQPSLSQLAALCKLANVSADWLLGLGVFAEGAESDEGGIQ